jgi:hypothetical protein
MPILAAGELEARKLAFLEAFAVSGTVRDACSAIGIDHARVYEWLREDHPAYDPAFAPSFALAKEAAADAIEASLRAQALRGRTAWDTTAAIFLLKGYRPQFRDTYQVNVRQESVSISMDLSDLPPADKALLLRRLADRAEGTHLLPEGGEP